MAIELGPQSQALDELHRELALRVRRGELQPWQNGALAVGLVRALRDDDVRGNATRALSLLRRLGNEAVPALERGLTSDDWQQRQLCAAVLRHMRGYEPSDRLLAVTVEGLRDDELPFDHRRRYTRGANNAWSGFFYLLRHGRGATPHLSAGLDSDDSQQRWLCARAAAAAGLVTLVDRAAPELVAHLRDNTIRGDAGEAQHALRQYGEAARPYLESALGSPDEQQCRLAGELLEELDRAR